MAYEGWLRLGGIEIVNNERARGITSTLPCPMAWLKGPRCGTLADALGDPEYGATSLPDAPWFDGSLPDVSGRFYGVFALSVTGLKSSTRTAGVTSGIDDGDVVGRQRKTSRQVRVRAILLAKGRDALEYGAAWLSAALDPDACGQHGSGCGSTDLEYLADCPPARLEHESDSDYALRVEPLRRFLHGVSIVSGPLERELHTSGDFWGQVFEWTFVAGRPWVYSATRSVDLPRTPTIVVDDTPYNLVEHPSAVLPGMSVLVSTNLSLNPSVESNATGWSATQDGVSITAGEVTSGRVTGELAAVGSSSYRAVFTAAGAGSNGFFAIMQDVIVSIPVRMSFSMWAGQLLISGSPVRAPIQVYIHWLSGSGTNIRNDLIGEIPVNGGVASLKSILPPPGTVTARVLAVAIVDSWDAGTVINFYADALALTIP